MSKEVDLKKLEQQAFLSYHGDGIIDLFLGIVIIWVTVLLAIIPEFFIFLIGSFVALLPAYTSAKKSFTVPRMGYVEFSASRQWNTKVLFMGFNFLVIIGVILGMLAWLVPPITTFIVAYYLIVLGVAGAFMFFMTGIGTGIRRFYGYGFIVFVGFIVAHLLAFVFVLPLFTLGCLMIVYGGFLLYRFTRKYPKGTEDDSDWQLNHQGG